jgi:hypothetical protein
MNGQLGVHRWFDMDRWLGGNGQRGMGGVA